MSKHKKSVITLLLGGFGDKFILFAQGILLVPIYLSSIGVEVYGYWLATGGVLAWLGAFDMRMAVVINQKISALAGSGRDEEIAKTFINGISAFSLILAPLLPLALWLYSPLVDFLELPPELHSDFYLAYLFAALGLMLSFMTSALAALPKGLLEPTFPVVVHFLCGLVQIAAVVYLLFLGYGVVAIGFALFLRFSLSTVVNLYYSTSLARSSKYSAHGFQPSVAGIREYLSLMPPLLFSRFTTGLVSKIEPTIILKFLGPELAASYSITKSAGVVLTGLANSVTASVFPSFASLCGGADKKRMEMAFFRCVELLSCASLLYFGGYTLLNQHFVSLWVGEEHFLGGHLTALIALSLASLAMSNFLNSALTAKGDIVVASWLRSGEEFSRLLLLILGAALFGVSGLPIAVTLTAILVIVVYSIRFRKQFSFSVFSVARIRNYLALMMLIPSVFACSQIASILRAESWVVFSGSLIVVIVVLLGICFSVSHLFRQQMIGAVRSLYSKLAPTVT